MEKIILVLTAVSQMLFLLFLPGWAIISAIFKLKDIDFIERIGLSVVFSIASVSLLVFYSSLFNVAVTETTVVIEATAVIALFISIHIVRDYFLAKNK